MKRLIAFLSCAGLAVATSFAQQGAPPDAPDMQELMKAMGQALSAGSNAPPVADFRELKALLPTELTGMKRKSASGEKTGMMGMNVAYAEGSYASDAGGFVEIKITDMAGMGAMGGLARAGWANVEIDRESDTGYERTTKINGHNAYEKYDSEQKSGQVEVMVNSRFMVEIQGSDVTADVLKEAMTKIDLEKLAELAPEPATPVPAAPAPAAPAPK
ncbi:MAG TPA: hypothetical protein VIH35_02150 [Kiritimatiellia bacterium]|jgi:hypothetical protein